MGCSYAVPLFDFTVKIFSMLSSIFIVPVFTKGGGSCMSNSQLWKYCTKEQCQDFILSLDLVPHSAGMSREKQLASLYMLSNRGAKNYHKEILTKKDGGTRTLMVPCSLLKAVQRNILHHVLEQRPVSDCARAYRKGTDILANAGPPSRIRFFLRPPPRFWQTCAAAGNACPRALRLPRPSPIW